MIANHVVSQETLPVFGRPVSDEMDQFPLAPEQFDWAVMAAGIYLVTPEVAARWLKCNTHNRIARALQIDAWARDMLAGKWRFNGDAFVFGTDGVLLDGQHRLHAVQAAGRPILAVVVTGVAPRAQETIDTGVKRTFGDQLQLRGVPNAKNAAALVMKIWLWRNDGIRWSLQKPTTAELFDVFADVPDVHVDLQRAAAARSAIKAPASVYGLASHLFRAIDEADAETFFDRLSSGVGGAEGDPVLVLRKRLIANAGARLKLGDAELLALIIKAWNHFRAGTRIKVIAWQAGGTNAEAFPEPR